MAAKEPGTGGSAGTGTNPGVSEFGQSFDMFVDLELFEEASPEPASPPPPKGETAAVEAPGPGEAEAPVQDTAVPSEPIASGAPREPAPVEPPPEPTPEPPLEAPPGLAAVGEDPPVEQGTASFEEESDPLMDVLSNAGAAPPVPGGMPAPDGGPEPPPEETPAAVAEPEPPLPVPDVPPAEDRIASPDMGEESLDKELADLPLFEEFDGYEDPEERPLQASMDSEFSGAPGAGSRGGEGAAEARPSPGWRGAFLVHLKKVLIPPLAPMGREWKWFATVAAVAGGAFLVLSMLLGGVLDLFGAGEDGSKSPKAEAPAESGVSTAPSRPAPEEGNPPPAPAVSKGKDALFPPGEETVPPTGGPGEPSGIELFRQGRYVEALPALERDVTTATLYLARAYQVMGRHEEALKWYQKVLWETPDRSAFSEIFSLAEELFQKGDYPGARNLYYAFLAQEDRIPQEIKNLASRAYFRIGRCLEEEALRLLSGHAEAAAPGRETAPGAAADRPRVEPGRGFPESPGDGKGAASLGLVEGAARIRIQVDDRNGLFRLYSLACVGVPVRDVLEALAEKAGLRLEVPPELEERLRKEVVSAFLKERRLETVLEYVTGQVGLTFTHSDRTLAVADLEARVGGDWHALKAEAVEAFRRSLYRYRGHPDAPKVYFEISRLHYLSGDFEAAIEPARTLLAEYPDFSRLPVALLNMASCYMEIGDYGQARDYLKELVGRYPEHPVAVEGMVALATAAWKEGNPEEAELTLRSMIDRYPSSPFLVDGRILLARIHVSLHRYASALEVLHAVKMGAVKDEGKVVAIHLLKGEAFLQEGKPESAVREGVAVVEGFPDNPGVEDALFILARAYAAVGRHFLAFAQCKELDHRFPKRRSDPELYLIAARELCALDLEEEALRWLDRGLHAVTAETRPAYEMYMLLGDILFDRGQYERAKTVYRRIFACDDPMAWEARLKYVQALMKQKDYHAALQAVRKAAQALPPGEPAIRKELCRLAGDCYSALGETEAAIAAYRGDLGGRLGPSAGPAPAVSDPADTNGNASGGKGAP